jgi:hypothetical protein
MSRQASLAPAKLTSRRTLPLIYETEAAFSGIARRVPEKDTVGFSIL